MPISRTPPPSVDGATALPLDNAEFRPPSGKLAAVTRKGNEITELINAGVDDENLLRYHYEAYKERIEALKEACFSQTGLNASEENKRAEWWRTNYSVIIGLTIESEKYLHGLGGAIPKTARSLNSHKSGHSSMRSGLTNTSSARIRLAEKKAKVIAMKEKDAKMYELQKEELLRKKLSDEKDLQLRKMNEEKELEHKRKIKILENNALEMETKLLEEELSKIDGLADEIEKNTIISTQTRTVHDMKFSTPVVKTEVDDNTIFLEVLRNQTEISEKIAKHQEKAELPKKELPVFSGENITEYRSFIQNFNRTIDVKCNNKADCLYYLEQYTSGIARQIVKSCSQSNAEEAYEAALKLLEEEFGNEHRTATAYLQKLETWPVIKSEDAEGLKQLAIYLMTCSNNMGSMTCMNQLNSPKEIMGVVNKLPFEIRRKWRNKTLELQENDFQVTFADLVKFVRLQSKLMNQAIFGQIKDVSKEPGSARKNILTTKYPEGIDSNENDQSGISVEGDSFRGNRDGTRLVDPGIGCQYCKKQNHELPRCFFFMKISYDQKLEFLRKMNLCFACFKLGHTSRGCTQRLECAKCLRKHPTILHKDNYVRDMNNSSNEVVQDSENHQLTENNFICSTKTDTVLETGAGVMQRGKILCCVIPVTIGICGREERLSTYAALDTCADACFMDASLLTKLGVKQEDTRMKINVIGQANSEIKTTVVNSVEVYDMEGVLKDTIPVTFSQKKWPFQKEDAPQRSDIPSELSKNVNFNFIDAGIGMIIGMNRYSLLKPLEVVDQGKNSVYASRHSLGWALNGVVQNSATKPVSVHRISVNNTADIENKIQQMFDHDYTDSFVMKKEPSENDLKWIKIMEDSIRMNDLNKYEIDLPMKHDKELPDNRVQVYRTFQSLMRKFETNENLFAEYNSFMNMMLANNFMERVPEEELSRKSWYLSHHAVYHKQKKSIRVVFNCSLKFGGISLNDCLYQGPDLTNNILGVILRFRQEPVAFMGDISKMFYQVNVSPKHRDFLRFFWIDRGNGNLPVEYRLTVHVFGATSSPSVANFALKQTAVDNSDFSKEAKTAVNRDFYVDDLLCSVDTPENAARLLTDVRKLVAKGGFHITNYVTNSLVLYNMMHTDIPDHVKFREILPNTNNLALGLVWKLQQDTLGFKINQTERPATRRGILSTIHGIYDPLGLSGPAIVPAKKIFQDTCILKLDWDAPLPPSIKQKWMQWKTDLAILENYEIKRSFKPSCALRTELHYFSDGSQDAYGSVVYVRFLLSNGKIHCSPVIAKARLTPMKSSAHRTIPRIELNGAKLSVLLHQILTDELDYVINAHYFWTDSSTVLHYINSESKQFTRFVANRVRFIRSSTEACQWKHVPGSLNPADCISRGMPIQKFVENETWKKGPNFLKHGEEFWPEQSSWKNEELESISPEIIVVKCATVSTENNFTPTEKLLQSSSCWFTLKRRVAWMIRFRSYLMGKHVPTDSISVRELEVSERAILRYTQHCFFSETSKAVQQCKTLPRNNSLRKLNPFLDSDGLLRLGGRLQSSSLKDFTKHPIILPNKSDHVVKLVISVHKLMGHSGRAIVVSKLREKFWIISLNSLVRQIQFNCVTCRKANARPYYQQMSELPPDRVESNLPAFTNTGCDYFGPFAVVNGRKHEKRYGVIFSCLSSRAVHIEMAYSLTTDSFLNAFRRFLARRGNVRLVRSDNGTNLTSGCAELRSAIKQWNMAAVEGWMQQHEIQWKFQPPSASNFGGAFEREIRSIRKVLNGLMNEQPLKLDDEQLNTLFCEVESIINSKPLTELSDDPSDFNALTPNHLLLLHSGATLPPGIFTKDDTFSRRRWKQVQYLADLFWHRFRKEYLPLLQMRQKWFYPNYNYTIGDLVLLIDQNLPRNQWSLGRVIKVYPDQSGTVRVVRLRVSKLRTSKVDKDSSNVVELDRPINKLILVKSNDALY